jgi:hypothetical protein
MFPAWCSESEGKFGKESVEYALYHRDVRVFVISHLSRMFVSEESTKKRKSSEE